MADSTPRSILWVEDDDFLATLVAQKFQRLPGYRLIQVSDGAGALAALESVVPAAIVLDILLPGENGFELLAKLRQNQRLAETPILVVSNSSQPDEVERAKALGAAKFLVKASVSLDEIVREVEAAMQAK